MKPPLLSRSPRLLGPARARYGRPAGGVNPSTKGHRRRYRLAMARLAALAAAALSLILITAAAAAGPALQPTSPPEGGYSLLVPVGWQLVKVSRPTHSQHSWRDPTDARARITVTLRHCRSCVLTAGVPAPSRVLPGHLRSHTRLSRWQEIYTLAPTPGALPHQGTIVITRRRGRVSGYARIDARLPSALATSSYAILTSFHDTGR
jgi:hypothetical protein